MFNALAPLISANHVAYFSKESHVATISFMLMLVCVCLWLLCGSGSVVGHTAVLKLERERVI